MRQILPGLAALVLVAPTALPASDAPVVPNAAATPDLAQRFNIAIDGRDSGRLFEGLGGADAGGATSVLLMSYPEPQRSQILDLLFKPKFGASMTTHYFEIGGDGNSTESTTPSHMHSRADLNFQRGWTWFMIREAKKRNPAITLDGEAWTCPGWIGNGNFWSQDMCDFYCAWIKGLKDRYGYDLDAVGCRNEGGVNIAFFTMSRWGRRTSPGARVFRFEVIMGR